MTRWISYAAAIALLIAAGAANGLWNDRWTVSHELETMTERLSRVPLVIGDWVGEDSGDPEFTRQLKNRGTLHELTSRVYRNRRTGAVVTLMLATGRPGPISTHNPMTCVAAGQNIARQSPVQQKQFALDGRTSTFTYCDFIYDGPIGEGIRIYWSWRHKTKGWIARGDADPRITFMSYRSLTKIYLSRALEPGSFGKAEPLDGEDGPITQFIKDCLPTIDEVLFQEEGSSQ